MDCQSNCVNKSMCSKFYFKTPFPFLRKKLCALESIPLETRTSFSKLDFLLWYNILRNLWCMWLILLKAQLWHIQTNGQSLNWKVTKALSKMPFLFSDKYCDIQDNARSFWQDCRQRLLMCSSNAKLLSILTPKSFSELIHLMIESLMFYGSRLIGW